MDDKNFRDYLGTSRRNEGSLIQSCKIGWSYHMTYDALVLFYGCLVFTYMIQRQMPKIEMNIRCVGWVTKLQKTHSLGVSQRNEGSLFQQCKAGWLYHAFVLWLFTYMTHWVIESLTQLQMPTMKIRIRWVERLS